MGSCAVHRGGCGLLLAVKGPHAIVPFTAGTAKANLRAGRAFPVVGFTG
jgi:hypothetical protein